MTKCEKCGRDYPIENNGVSYAIAESASSSFYKFKNNIIERRLFNNVPVDMLEEAWQDALDLEYQNYSGQKYYDENPANLIPVVKKYHDALRKRLQCFLTLDYIALAPEKKGEIKNDRPMYNLLKLLNCLREAFSSQKAKIESVLNTGDLTLKKIMWVRHKSEHVISTVWPVPAKIFTDMAKQPDSPDVPEDILNYDFIKRVNNAVIDAYLLIIDLDHQINESCRKDSIERFRINS
jgi:hypothetical protein